MALLGWLHFLFSLLIMSCPLKVWTHITIDWFGRKEWSDQVRLCLLHSGSVGVDSLSLYSTNFYNWNHEPWTNWTNWASKWESCPMSKKYAIIQFFRFKCTWNSHHSYKRSLTFSCLCIIEIISVFVSSHQISALLLCSFAFSAQIAS